MLLVLLALLVSWLPGQLSISPASPTVQSGAAQVFTASGGTPPYTFSLTPGSAGSITSGGTYTAPSSATVKQQAGGCMLQPPDHIFNTRIDALPALATSNALIATLPGVGIGFSPSFGTNLMTNSTGTFAAVFYYTTSNNGNFQINTWPNLARESGVFTAPFGGLDRHVIAVNRETCQFSDIYNNYNVGDNTVQSCPLCTAQSGVKYNGYDFALPTTGATDAAGMAQQPVSLRLSDIQAGAITHALRFTLSNSYIQPAYDWPATANAFPFCSPGSCFKYGQYLRLKSSYSIAGFSATAQIILLGLQRYGMILTDGGTNMDIQTNTDLMLLPSVRAALTEIANASIQPTNFEVVDTSTMAISASSGAVSLSNGYVTPTQFAEVKVTDALSATATVRVALQGIAVGVPDPAINVYAGQVVTLTSWVTGASNQSVTWAKVSGSGSVAGSSYTAPSSITTPQTARLSVTAVADSAAITYVDVTVWPDNDSGAIRIDVGSSSDTTDGGHTYWAGETYSIFDSGLAPIANDVGAGWAGGTPTFQKTARQNYADSVYKFYLPNGNYKVTVSEGLGNQSGTIPTTDYSCHLESQGQLARRNLTLATVSGGTFLTAGSVDIPMQVTDGTGYFAQRHLNSGTGFCVLTGLAIVPDATPAHITIDDAGVTGDITISQTRQFYSVGWYMSNSVTWSVVAGPGTVDSSGLYTASSTPPGATTTVTVRATSTVDAAKTADISFNFIFGTITVTPANSTISRGQTLQYTASINGASYSNVSWSRSGSQGSISNTGLYFAPSSITDGTITITATSLDDGSKTGTTSLSLQQLINPIRIAAGRSSVDGPATDHSGNLWAIDVGYANLGQTYGIAGLSIANTLDDDVYRWHRYAYGSSSDVIIYSIPNLPVGLYSVTLRWAEIETTSQGNKMDVIIEGVTVLSDFDPVAAAGAVRTAYDQTFVTAVVDGTANISFAVKSGAGYIGASINAIQVIDLGPLGVRTVGSTAASGKIQWR